MRNVPLAALIASALLAGPLWSASPKTDVLPIPRRQPTVDLATRLARPPSVEPVPEQLKNPFNPPDFGGPDPDEPQTNAGRAAAQPGASGTAAPLGNRELLETIAARIQPTGSVVVRGKPLLTFAGRTPTVGVGQSFVVTYNDRDHELEVVAIDRTTFTLRYGGEEITRPIKPTR